MLKKTLRFEKDVLDVLASMDWRNDGRLGVITGGQLERNLYTRVNKALEAMGGKWNRKEGGHVFLNDPRNNVEGLVENGSLEIERDGFFETPKAVFDRMLELVPPITERDFILEPSAGMGAIAKNLPGERGMITCVEKNEDRAEYLDQYGFTTYCADFLEWNPELTYDRIFMNPPFENLQDIDHVKRAWELLEPGGALVSVMSNSPFFRSDKKATDFREWFISNGGYSESLPAGSFKESGTGVNAVLVVMRKNP